MCNCFFLWTMDFATDFTEDSHLATFNITFVLAIRANEGKDKEVKEKHSKKSHKDKDKDKDKDKEKKTGNTIEVVNDLILFHVDKPDFFAHLEYVLIPGALNYAVDINSWGDIAKVYSADGECALKTMRVGSIYWISFSITHCIQLTMRSLYELHAHKVEFNVSQSRNKAGERAKKENAKTFYLHQKDPFISSTNDLVEVLEFDNTEYPPGYQTVRQVILDECILKTLISVGKEVTLLRPGPCSEHSESLMLTVQSISADSEVQNEVDNEAVSGMNNDILKAVEIEFLTSNMNIGSKSPQQSQEPVAQKKKAPPTKKVKSAKSAKSAKSPKKPKGNGALNFSLHGESLFTGLRESSCYIKNGLPDIPYALATISVRNLLSAIQKQELNPLCVRIKNIEQFPVETLRSNGFNRIFLKYTIPNFTLIKTRSIDIPLSKNIDINDAHAILTYNANRVQLVQFLQTERLIIEVYGEKDNTENGTNAKIFGLDECDVDHSHCQQTLSTGRTYRCGALSAAKQEPCTDPVKLAVAGFDIHCVMKGKTIYEAGALLTPASSKHYYPVSADNFVPPEDYTAINLAPDHVQDDELSPFTDEELSENESKIKIEVEMGFALQPSLHLLLTSPSVFSRLCVVLKDLKLACHVIAEVFKVNSASLGPIIPLTDYQSAMACDYNITKFYYSQRNESTANGLSLSRDKVSMSYLSTELSIEGSLLQVDTTPITGFAIDAVDKVIIFAEGPANSQFQRLWQAVMHIKENQGDVMYNSDLAFDDRLYTPFLVFACGFMVITLKEQLEDTLSRPKIFAEGAVPLPACRALKKLKQLLEARDMKDASQGHMFPTVNELLSFDLEFGVPTMCSYETENYS